MNTKILIKSLVLVAAVLPLSLVADVQPAALFADHMVIQQETRAPIWGTGDAGEAVTVTGSWGEKAKTVVDEKGHWRVDLKTPRVAGPHTITIQGSNTVEIKDVLSGEVWICSGQSNMDFVLNQLRRSKEGRTEEGNVKEAEFIAREIVSASDAMFRQFTVTKNTSAFEEVHTLSGNWKSSTPENNGDFSATAYFFGKELRSRLQVPVGLIKCAWGGTRVEAWMPKEAFAGDPQVQAYFDEQTREMKTRAEAWSPEKAEANFQAALKMWEETRQGRRPRPANPPVKSQQHPATLFNAMVHPVIPYAIRGAIWYQGEANSAFRTEAYEESFRAMITGWRTRWGQGDFPFYYAQLASFKAPPESPVEHDTWATIQDYQRRTLGLKNTGMAVLNDIGEAQDVHPHNKMDVGRRLALWALKYDYKQPIPAWSGPLYRGHTIQDGRVRIEFEHAGSGLMVGSKEFLGGVVEVEEPLASFQVCGADRKWQWAQAEITGKSTVTVSHPDVPEPTVVRYAWAANPAGANLYNRDGLPASLFTTESVIPVAPPPEPKINQRENINNAPAKKVSGMGPTYADVAYDVHKRTRLDFWQAEGEGPRPVKVFIHGGGWIQGDKSRKVGDVSGFLEKGISVAAINYRYSVTDPLPVPVLDAVRAIQFLRYKAKEWNIDKNRFLLTGGSAGGCTSLIIACHDDFANPDSDDPVERESSRVQGASVNGAQTAIDPKLIEPWIGPNVYHQMIYRAVGEDSIEAALANYAQHEAMYKEFSAYNHLTADDPPLFLAYRSDMTLPSKNLGHGIHHGVFGLKLQEKSKTVGHNKVYLSLGSKMHGDYDDYEDDADFINDILLGE